MKIKDEKMQFESLTKNKELWDEVLNSSDRNAVLVATAAFDTHLERILTKYFLQESGASKSLIDNTLNKFATRINISYSLGLISSDERHDLNLLRDIRNAFAHNLFGCDFSNPEVTLAVSNLILARKAKATPENVGIKTYFNIGVLTLEHLLLYRLSVITPIIECQNMTMA